ncbi:MAG: hypothetical protein KDA59_13135 [Planctomycetales bacterium]|nr:hypothetical protein [Planctomycetales bacterium]
MSKKFVFSLQAVLDTRAAEQRQRRLQLADALRAEADALAAEQSVRAELARLESDLRLATASTNIDLLLLTETHRRQHALRNQLVALAAQRAELSSQANQCREALVAANRDLRVMESLREKQADEHRRERARRVLGA